MAAFAAALKQLKTANGCSFQVPDDHIKRSEVYPPDPAGFLDGPLLYVYEGTEKIVEREYCGHVRVKNELTVSVTEWLAWVKPDATEGEEEPLSLPAKLNAFDGEVIKAAMADQRLGGYGFSVTLAEEGSDDDFLEGEFYIGIRERAFILAYWCREDNPFE